MSKTGTNTSESKYTDVFTKSFPAEVNRMIVSLLESKYLWRLSLVGKDHPLSVIAREKLPNHLILHKTSAPQSIDEAFRCLGYPIDSEIYPPTSQSSTISIATSHAHNQLDTTRQSMRERFGNINTKARQKTRRFQHFLDTLSRLERVELWRDLPESIVNDLIFLGEICSAEGGSGALFPSISSKKTLSWTRRLAKTADGLYSGEIDDGENYRVGKLSSLRTKLLRSEVAESTTDTLTPTAVGDEVSGGDIASVQAMWAEIERNEVGSDTEP